MLVFLSRVNIIIGVWSYILDLVNYRCDFVVLCLYIYLMEMCDKHRLIR